MSNHCAPKLLAIVDRNAMLSPQPGLPRRQMPYTPFFGSWISAAANAPGDNAMAMAIDRSSLVCRVMGASSRGFNPASRAHRDDRADDRNRPRRRVYGLGRRRYPIARRAQ